MFLILNRFKLYIFNLKILMIVSNFNKIFSNIIFNNFYRRLMVFGFFKKNIIILFLHGSLEVIILFKILFKNLFFDICLLFGFIIKNKTFHFEIISLNIFFFILKLCYNYNIIFINSLIIINNDYNLLYKILNINNSNLKIFIKFLNFLYYLKFLNF